MKGLFNRKRSNTVMVTAWQKISNTINRKAHTWADWLNGKAAAWNARKLKTAFVLLGIVWMAGSVFVAWQAIESKQKVYTVTSFAVPKHIEQNPVIADTTVIQAVNRIEHFKQWLDSLHQRGSPVYDSIIQARPGLMDSILFIEQYYSTKK